MINECSESPDRWVTITERSINPLDIKTLNPDEFLFDEIVYCLTNEALNVSHHQMTNVLVK